MSDNADYPKTAIVKNNGAIKVFNSFSNAILNAGAEINITLSDVNQKNILERFIAAQNRLGKQLTVTYPDAVVPKFNLYGWSTSNGLYGFKDSGLCLSPVSQDVPLSAAWCDVDPTISEKRKGIVFDVPECGTADKVYLQTLLAKDFNQLAAPYFELLTTVQNNTVIALQLIGHDVNSDQTVDLLTILSKPVAVGSGVQILRDEDGGIDLIIDGVTYKPLNLRGLNGIANAGIKMQAQSIDGKAAVMPDIFIERITI